MKTNFRQVLIADDEPAARQKLARLLQQHCRIDQLKEAIDGLDAVRQIHHWQPELVFLDILMPQMSGLQVALATKQENYQLVFVTAYDQYAVQAFTTHAVDYLLKPVTPARLTACLEKLATMTTRIPEEQLALLSQNLEQKQSEQLAVKHGQATVIVSSHHIAYIDTIGGYCRIVLTTEGKMLHLTDSLLSDTPLEMMASQLPQAYFLRVHRSYLVNCRQIRAYHTVLRRMYITLQDFPDNPLPVSRRNANLIRSRWVKN